MARPGYDETLERQRKRQKCYRHNQRERKRPGRDDIARVALHWMLTRAAETDMLGHLEKIGDVLIDRLVDQGFARAEAFEVFGGLIDKYVDESWSFRRKPHLLFPEAPPPITT
ncbi:hypothetical protein [Rhizobium sp. TRM95796]|uniref:hypothetical protein n=1 Tax=Rhizobium sp. TRM95796 TaxID=2979862 RepID=UPI0021E7EEDE|nr:hypothetical protein [Rhizobium sp. TRM95796]MCV3768890.1 hypothetical protein [Rhizobium sp. TRM95796]